MVVDQDRTLAEIVDESPGSARIFEGRGLDYCCHGDRSLAVACDEAGIDSAELLDELATLGSEPSAEWTAMGPVELADHIEATHHAFLHTELPRLAALAAKVESVHGERHPELADVAATFGGLKSELEPHLAEEERVLFPAIRQTAVDDGVTEGTADLIAKLEDEHDSAGALLAHLRAATGNFLVPADGCASYQALYEGLAGLETDTHLHVHKENNVLFPAVTRG
ncbi:MAG: iron-sulfur cluster repair di-iron protein [Acidimicrobiia bacterium]|nr:iron-sulfur cluster repair di-iron protein [Acidimicrobiia bacterium]